MARKTAKASQNAEDESQEVPKSESPRVSKADAARAALAEGIEGPKDAVAFIKTRFGIEMNPQHFSAFKSQLKKKEAEAEPKKEAPAKKRGRPVEGYVSPPPKQPAGGEADLIGTLESLKPLIAQYGAEKVKRLVDLLG